MMKFGQLQWVMCLVIGVVFAVSYAPAEAAKKNSAAQKIIKRIEQDIKNYERTLKAAQERMKAANAAGEEVQPLIEPAEQAMQKWKAEMNAQQRERAEASRWVQDKLASDPEIERAFESQRAAEGKRDELAEKLMPQIETRKAYRELAEKLDAAERYMAKVKREERNEDVPYAATALAAARGALGTYVQEQLAAIPAYKALADDAEQAQSHRRATERAADQRYREEAGLERIDAMLASKREAYRESRDTLRDLELKFKSLRSAYDDAASEAGWAAKRIELGKKRIKSLKR